MSATGSTRFGGCFSQVLIDSINDSGCANNFTIHFTELNLDFPYAPLCCKGQFIDLNGSIPARMIYTVFNLILPVMIIFPIVIFFNFDLASGPKQAVLFFYQGISLASTTIYNYNPASFYCYTGLIGEVIQLKSPFTYIIWRQASATAPYRILEYVKLPLAALTVCATILLVRCSWCPLNRCLLPWAKVRRAVRNFREKNLSKDGVIPGICSVVVLTYGNMVTTSFSLLQRARANCVGHDRCPRLCPDIAYNSEEYRPYIAVAAAILVLLLPLPLSLIYYPSIPALFHKLTKRSLPRFPKLDPVFDVFQGVYKDNMRWFAGVHFLYHYLLWLIHAYTFNSFRGHFFLMCALALITTIQSILRPFKKASHNYVQTLFLLSFVLQSIFSLFLSCSHGRGDDSMERPDLFAALLVWLCLGILPLLAIIVFYVRKYCLRRFRLGQSKRVANFVSKYLKGWKHKNNAELTDSLQDDLLVVDRHAYSFESVASSNLSEN